MSITSEYVKLRKRFNFNIYIYIYKPESVHNKRIVN